MATAAFQEPRYVLARFGYNQGWRVGEHPRFLVVLTNSGLADIVGFGDEGVWTALGNGDGTFQEPDMSSPISAISRGAGVGKHREISHGPHERRIFRHRVGFGDDGVWTALGNGDGTFQEPKYVLANFGSNQGWRVDRHPRFLVILTNSGHADIVGFGDAGVWTALGNGDGTFQEAQYVLDGFGYEAGSWRVDETSEISRQPDPSKWIFRLSSASATTACGRRSATATAHSRSPNTS